MILFSWFFLIVPSPFAGSRIHLHQKLRHSWNHRAVLSARRKIPAPRPHPNSPTDKSELSLYEEKFEPRCKGRIELHKENIVLIIPIILYVIYGRRFQMVYVSFEGCCSRSFPKTDMFCKVFFSIHQFGFRNQFSKENAVLSLQELSCKKEPNFHSGAIESLCKWLPFAMVYLQYRSNFPSVHPGLPFCLKLRIPY